VADSVHVRSVTVRWIVRALRRVSNLPLVSHGTGSSTACTLPRWVGKRALWPVKKRHAETVLEAVWGSHSAAANGEARILTLVAPRSCYRQVDSLKKSSPTPKFGTSTRFYTVRGTICEP
jgi:hypothetical protein